MGKKMPNLGGSPNGWVDDYRVIVGHKVIIRGNHDLRNTTEYRKAGPKAKHQRGWIRNDGSTVWVDWYTQNDN